MKKELITPPTGKTMGPYSPGIKVGETVYVSGQGPLDPQTGKITGDTIEAQTEQTLQNVQRILEAAGCSMDDCVKMTVHLLDIKQFDRFNEVYQRFFHSPYPTRTTVESGLWGGILVEIDAIAVKSSAPQGN